MKSKKEQKVPKWFDGDVYLKGGTVRNPYSGEEYDLNALELSIYDLIMGANILMEAYGGPFSKDTIPFQKDLRKGLDWFIVNNSEAYMVLLD